MPTSRQSLFGKMSTKLYLGFAAPAVVILGIGAFALYSFARIDRQVATIYDDRVIPLQQLKVISDRYAVQVIDAVNKAHAGLISTQEALRSIDNATDAIEQTWDTYRQTQLTSEEAELATQAEALFRDANAEIEALQRFLQTASAADLARYDGALYEVIDPLTAKIQELIDLQLEVAQQERVEAASIYQWTRAVFWVLLVSAVILASPLGYFLSRMVTAALKDTIDKVAAATMEIASATEEHERVASQQAASVQETTTTMDQLSAFAQNSAQQAESVASQSQESRTLAQNGSQAAHQTLDSIHYLQDQVGMVAQQITHLSEQTSQIGAISELVSEIANQTNMLALNAAVEAVRAGEQGKGFAIVAGEIRKLADQSKQSSEKINHLVADIQKAIHSTVKATTAGTQTVDTSVNSVQVSADAFSRVSQSTEQVVVSGQQIALSAEQQVKAIQEVLTAMHSLNQAASETSNSIKQTKLGTQQLNNIVERLKAMV